MAKARRISIVTKAFVMVMAVMAFVLPQGVDAAIQEIVLDPASATNPPGTSHTVTATVTPNGGAPVAGMVVMFGVVSGPNADEVLPQTCALDPSCHTDAQGHVSWGYTSNGMTGTDVIRACFIKPGDGNPEVCTEATKTWAQPGLSELGCVETVNPHGQQVPRAHDRNQDGFYELLGLAGTQIWVRNVSNTHRFGPFRPGDKIKLTEAPGATPSEKKIGSTHGQAQAVLSHITLDSDAVLVAIDGAGNVTTATCYVPPKPR